MDLSALTTVVEELVERVAALEAPRGRRPAVLSDAGATEDRIVHYRGAGSVADRVVVWQVDRRWDDLVSVDPAVVAPALAALGSPQRVQIVQLLLGGQASTAELTTRLDGRSSGQLFHHLKELLAAGVIHQPARGTYAIRDAHVVPLVTLLSCALDVRGADDREVT